MRLNLIFGSTLLLLSFACKTTRSAPRTGLSSQDQFEDAENEEWVQVPRVLDAFSPDILEQIRDPQDSAASPQVCLYFHQAADRSSSERRADMFQIWLEPAEFCGPWERPDQADRRHQFFGSEPLAIKNPSDIAWKIYLDNLAIGDATIDNATGLPLIHQLCTGPDYTAACLIVASPKSFKIEPKR